MRRHFPVAAALLLLVPAHAFALDDLLNPRGVALGGSTMANATGALGPLQNPAGMVQLKQITAEAMYGFTVQSLGSELHLSVVDGVTNPHVAAGLYYSYVHASPKVLYGGPAGPSGATRDGSEWGSSLGIPVGDHFAIGATGKYVRTSTTIPDPLNPMTPKTLDSSTDSATADGFTLDIGLLLRVGESLNIAAVGYNLIPLHSVEAPIGLGFGFAYLAGNRFILSADARIDFDKYHNPGSLDPTTGNYVPGDRRTTARIGVGAEYIAADSVPIRIGYAQDAGIPGYNGSFLSAGLGYQGKNFAIDIAYRQRVNAGKEEQILAGIRLMGQ
jgi:hypothetical protein